MDQNQNQYQYQNQYYTPPKNAAYYRARAREVLKKNFGMAIIVFLLASLLGGASTGGGVSFNFGDFNTNSNEDVEIEVDTGFGTQVENMLREALDAYYEGGIFHAFATVPFLGFLAGIVVVAMIVALAYSLFVGSPVALGYQRYNLDLVDGKGNDLNILFRYFKVGYAKSIGLRIVHSLIIFACSLPLLLATVAYLALVMAARVGSSSVNLALIGVATLGYLVVTVLVAALEMVVTYRYNFCFMILAEYPEIGVMDALRNSAHLMRGNKWRLFCLRFSFIGWIFLASLCTCGVGMFVLAPYMQAAEAVFYDDIANRAAAREAVFPSLNPDDYNPEQQFR